MRGYPPHPRVAQPPVTQAPDSSFACIPNGGSERTTCVAMVGFEGFRSA